MQRVDVCNLLIKVVRDVLKKSSNVADTFILTDEVVLAQRDRQPFEETLSQKIRKPQSFAKGF